MDVPEDVAEPDAWVAPPPLPPMAPEAVAEPDARVASPPLPPIPELVMPHREPAVVQSPQATASCSAEPLLDLPLPAEPPLNSSLPGADDATPAESSPPQPSIRAMRIEMMVRLVFRGGRRP